MPYRQMPVVVLPKPFNYFRIDKMKNKLSRIQHIAKFKKAVKTCKEKTRMGSEKFWICVARTIKGN